MHKPTRINITSSMIAGSIGKVLDNRFGKMSQPIPPSEQQEFARSTLERAGFKIGPGVDLKPK